jgi:hypothetical protein
VPDPLSVQRKTTPAASSIVSWTQTRRPNHGCHRYKSARKPVPWVFSNLVVQRDQNAPVVGQGCAGGSSDSGYWNDLLTSRAWRPSPSLRSGLGFRHTHVVASRRCLVVGAYKDLSGRFNFWCVLLHTRAITPPRVPAGLWLGSVFLRRGGWSLLLLVAVLAAGVVVRLSQRDPPVQFSAVSPPPTSAPLGPAPRAPPW